jgi:hypothetical protein
MHVVNLQRDLNVIDNTVVVVDVIHGNSVVVALRVRERGTDSAFQAFLH